MDPTLALFLSKRDDYLENLRRCTEQKNERQQRADNAFDSQFVDFKEKLHESIRLSTSPNVSMFFRYMKSIKAVYNEQKFLELLKEKLDEELPSLFKVKEIRLISNNHPTFGLLESASVVLEPTIDIFNEPRLING